MALASCLRWRAEPRASTRRLHSASGVFPLGAYLCFHAWEHWPVRRGRDPLFARLTETASPVLELALVLLPLLVHAALGVRLLGAPDRQQIYASPAFRKLQAATGIVSAGFIAFHLLGAWLPRLREPNAIAAAYSGVLEQAGRLPGLVLYAVGLAAVCTHFGQGLGAALLRLFPGRIPPTLARAGGVAIGILLWLAFLNELASYASYAPLL